jgi:hypothetical protein
MPRPGCSGTRTSPSITGHILTGLQDKETLEAVIEEELADGHLGL